MLCRGKTWEIRLGQCDAAKVCAIRVLCTAGMRPPAGTWRRRIERVLLTFFTPLPKTVLTRFNLNVSTVDVQRPWFNFALDNNLVMHTTLALAAAYWTSCTPVPDALIQREGFLQKGAAMEGIKEALTGKTEISNAIVGAVANLVNVEVRRISATGQFCCNCDNTGIMDLN